MQESCCMFFINPSTDKDMLIKIYDNSLFFFFANKIYCLNPVFILFLNDSRLFM